MAMRWLIKVTQGEEAVWISLLVSLGMVILTVLFLWLWPGNLGGHNLARSSFSELGNCRPSL